MSGIVVVPVYNEAANIEAVIAELLERFPREQLLFIDDGSSDGSHLLLEKAGVRYLRHPINLGYDEGLRTGMREVLRRESDYVIFCDADGQHRPEDVERIIRSWESEPCDLIIGSRYRDAPKSGLSMRSFGTRSFSWLTTRLSGVEVTDVTNGLKLLSRRIIPAALKLPSHDLHAELIVGLATCGAKIREEPITVLPRTAGESMYTLYSAFVYPARTALCLVAEQLFHRRLRSELAPPDESNEKSPAMPLKKGELS